MHHVMLVTAKKERIARLVLPSQRRGSMHRDARRMQHPGPSRSSSTPRQGTRHERSAVSKPARKHFGQKSGVRLGGRFVIKCSYSTSTGDDRFVVVVFFFFSQYPLQSCHYHAANVPLDSLPCLDSLVDRLLFFLFINFLVSA